MLDSIVIEYLPTLLKSAIWSFIIALCSAIIGSLFGTALALGQTYGSKYLQAIVSLYLTIVRGTPMLIQITFLYILLGAYISAFFTAIIAIGLNSAAYISQVIKSGINSVSTGQIEAAQTLGIPNYHIIKSIVLPQAFSVIIPSLGNELITLIKDTSLAYTIGVMELFQTARIIISRTYDPVPIYILISIIYLFMTTGVSVFINILEKRLNFKKN